MASIFVSSGSEKNLRDCDQIFQFVTEGCQSSSTYLFKELLDIIIGDAVVVELDAAMGLQHV